MLDHDRIRTLASQLSVLADTCSRSTAMTGQMVLAIERRLDDIDKRLKALEAAEAARSVGITPQQPMPGCVCPAGAERTCKGYGCPRTSQNMGPSTEPKAFVF